jgi:hypothetical protein
MIPDRFAAISVVNPTRTVGDRAKDDRIQPKTVVNPQILVAPATIKVRNAD